MDFKRKKGTQYGCAWISSYKGMIVRFTGESGAWTATLGEHRAHASTLKAAYERVATMHDDSLVKASDAPSNEPDDAYEAYQAKIAAKAAEAQAEAKAAVRAAASAYRAENATTLDRLTRPVAAVLGRLPMPQPVGLAILALYVVLCAGPIALAERACKSERVRGGVHAAGRVAAGVGARVGIALVIATIALGGVLAVAIDAYAGLASGEVAEEQ
jgi:hypothetical protein